MLRYCFVIQRWRSSQHIWKISCKKKKNQWHFRLRHLSWDTSGNLVLFLVSVWLHKGFGGISNGFVLLLLHAVVLSEAMMMCSTAIRCESGILLFHLYGFLVAHLNHEIRHWGRLFSYSSSGRNLLSHHCVREQKQVYFGPVKVGKFVSLFFSIFMKFAEVIFSSNHYMVSNTSNSENCTQQILPLPCLMLQLAVVPVWTSYDCRSRS